MQHGKRVFIFEGGIAYLRYSKIVAFRWSEIQSFEIRITSESGIDILPASDSIEHLQPLERSVAFLSKKVGLMLLRGFDREKIGFILALKNIAAVHV